MSERMIELQRARLGLPPITSASKQPNSNNTMTNNSHHQSVSATASAAAPAPTPQQAAAATLLTEDEQLKTFLQKMQDRNDNTTSDRGPTVPTALSRRMLQRQGVGYLDDTVAAVTSAAADRFLATVLQQAVACRDQRIKGATLAREEARKRKRHRQQYKEDVADRHRRNEARMTERCKQHKSAIDAAEALNKKSKDGAGDNPSKSKKKKKKPAPAETKENGNKETSEEKKGQEEDEASYDSLDEEEDYYQRMYGDEDDEEESENDEDDEDDTRFTVLLRDVVRPLEAWKINLTGKLGVGATPDDASDGEDDSDEEEAKEDGDAAGGTGLQVDGIANDTGENPPSPSKGDSSDNPTTSAAPTPVPGASAGTPTKVSK
mmetsp:Transcript_30406/g.46640  ORF Transcript_30406/g.46640 Transcript_30406/m.46640 type:complete len:377 (+) Transcript_30406:127-1257(+)